MQPKNIVPGFDFRNPSIRPIELVIHSVNVEGFNRPLHVTWTPELEQNVQAYHGINVEEELTTLLTQNLANEIDREILRNIWDLNQNEIEENQQTLMPLQPRQQIRRHSMIVPVGEETDVGFPIFPIVRRVFARTVGLDLVNVQPMELPRQMPYWFDPIYQNTEEPTVYDDGSWSLGNIFEGSIGIKMELIPHQLKYKNRRRQRRLISALNRFRRNRS